MSDDHGRSRSRHGGDPPHREDRDADPARRRSALPRRPSRDEIEEEIEHHLRGRVDELVASGYDRESAEREARRRFGSVARARRETERVYRRRRRVSPRWLLSELAGGLQSLRRRPTFTVTAILLLAIGIGTTTAMLAVLDAYLLRELPFPHAERLAWVNPLPPDPEGGPFPPASDWRELPEIELAVTWDRDAFTLVGDGRPEEVYGSWVSPDFFPAFGVEPALGRAFTEDEIGPDAAPVAIIGHDLWQSRFGGDPDVLGRTIRVYASDRPDETTALTIVGVLPADWWYVYDDTQILVPLSGLRTAYVVRLAPGVELEEAAARMTTYGREAWGPDFDGWSIQLLQMHDRHVRQVRPLLEVLGAGVVLVLLIACANVAVLLVVQAAERSREFAVRAALGAGRGRLAVRLLLEAGLLAVAGATIGVLVAGQALTSLAPAIERQLGARVPGGAMSLTLDPRVVLMSAGITGAVTLLFGLAPLAVGLGRDLSSALPGGGRGLTRSARQRSLRTGLVVAELAVSLTLLMGAGLTLRSAAHLSNLDPGFDSRGLLRIGMGLSSARYPAPEEWNARVTETLREFRGVPGVDGAVAAIPSPFSFATGVIQPSTGPLAEADRPPRAAIRYVTPGYFATLRIGFLRGRDFAELDGPGAEPVAIVSEELAARLWPGERALGKSVRIPQPMADGNDPWRRIVGVVADTREGLTEDGEFPDAYVPLAQAPFRYAYLVVRSRQPEETLVSVLERRVWDDDPEQPLSRPVLVRELVREASATPRALARLLTVFAGFGALLAVVGVYGVIAFAARQRRRELAVRVALGAAARDLRQMVLWHGVKVVCAGLIAGLGGAWLMARSLASQVHGVSPTDPSTFAVVTALLAAIALGGVVLPARRAAATDPMELLREE